MTKLAIISTDPLIMKVRHVLRSLEPRPEPINPGTNNWGTKTIECQNCGERVRNIGYNQHWSSNHGTHFWREQALIDLIKGELSK